VGCKPRSIIHHELLSCLTISNRSICFLRAFLRLLYVRHLVPLIRYEFHAYAVMMQRVRIRMSALNWAWTPLARLMPNGAKVKLKSA